MNVLGVVAGILLLLSGPVAEAGAHPARPRAVQADSAYTPARGSAERKAILDAKRAHMRRNDPRPLIFVVPYLRVQRGWAWLLVRPQSPDGRSRYEGESTLLRRRAGRWEVVEVMSAEGGDDEPECAYFQRLRRRFPAAPAAIFPPGGRRPCPAGR